jgi:hypothetical protein
MVVVAYRSFIIISLRTINILKSSFKSTHSTSTPKPKTQKIDYDQDSRLFNQEIVKIKNRLQPLVTISKSTIKVKVLNKTTSKEKSWYDPNEFIPKYKYTYQLTSKNLKSQIHQAIDYRQRLSISQAYKIPNQQKMIATVKYLGLPFETGYTIEDPVLLIPKK